LVLLLSPWFLLVLPFSRRRVLRSLVHLGLLGLDEMRYRDLARAFAVALVRGALAELGITNVEVLASRLRAGRLGMRSVWHNVGRRKVELLARHGIEAWQVAYSDSSQDLPMLALAAEAVLVNATPKLCKRVEKALGRSVTRAEWR